MTSKKVKKKNPIFSRVTLITVLGFFVLLIVSMLITTGLITLVAQYGHLGEDNVLVFGVVALAISIAVGVALSFAFSAIMVRIVTPYLYALQKIADCDFSVRIQDSPMVAGFGLAESFNDTAKQLASVETLREDFVSNFSHEFKTPIVSISGFAKLLKSPNLSKAEHDEYLDVIIDESARLVRLSESVLMLSRLDSQTIVNETFRLDEQIRQCALLFQRQCAEKDIELSVDLQEITLVNERKLLSQIWVNLISNAVKFTDGGGKVEISATQQDGKVTVTVKDNGCGMDEEVQKNIFNKFYQGDKSHSTEGNGLGLPVVKKICELLQLQLTVESQLGQGSTFTVVMDGQSAVKNHTTATKQ